MTEISVRDLHNDMIKLYENCGLDCVFHSVKQKVLISDTTLRLFIPPQVCKTIPRLHQICGCDIFIIPKDMQIDLNRFRTNMVSDLKHKSVGKHTLNSAYSTKSS